MLNKDVVSYHGVPDSFGSKCLESSHIEHTFSTRSYNLTTLHQLSALSAKIIAKMRSNKRT